jgi:sugar phosphate isomerase/epimerase
MKTCLHTVSYAGTWGQVALSLEQTIDKAADLGFDGIMLMAKRPHASVLDMTDQRRAAIRARLVDTGLECACVAGYTNFTADAAHGDVPLLEMQIDHVTQLGKLAADLDCCVVRIFTGYETGELAHIQAWERCVGAIRECCDRVAHLDVTLGVQNHHDIAAGYEAMHEFIRAVDRENCRACFDAWSPTLHGADVVAAAEKMAPLAVHTTAADYVKLPRYRYRPGLVNYTEEPAYVQAVPMGEGIIDYEGFLAALTRGGYDGYVGYEMCSHLRGGGSMENLDRFARRFLDFVQPYL